MAQPPFAEAQSSAKFLSAPIDSLENTIRQLQSSASRKKRSLPDSLANGLNRPEAEVLSFHGVGPLSRKYRSFRAGGTNRSNRPKGDVRGARP